VRVAVHRERVRHPLNLHVHVERVVVRVLHADAVVPEPALEPLILSQLSVVLTP
jgi:hypothetical protein